MTTKQWAQFYIHWLWLTSAVALGQLAPWQKLSPMPTPRYGLAAVVWRGQIVVIGGRDELGQTLVKVESYDPGTEMWSNFTAELQEARFNAAALVYRDAMYVIGGSRDDQTLNTVERFNEQSNRWEVLAENLQTGRDGPAAAVLQDTLLVIGGFDEGGAYLKSLERYDAATGQWSFARWQLTLPRASLEALSLRDTLFTFGGLFFGPVPVLERYYSQGSQRRAEMLIARGNMASAVLQNQLWAIGGAAQEGPTNTVEYYDPAQNKWFEDVHLSLARELHAAVEHDNRLYIVGGLDADQNVLADLEVTMPASTGVQNLDEKLPHVFELHSHPNPFATRVQIIVPEITARTSECVLEIFALDGTRVRTLSVTNTRGGLRAVWDGHDENNHETVNGVYFVRAQVGAQRLVKKILKLNHKGDFD